MTAGVVTLGETMGLFRAVELGALSRVTDFKLGIGGAESNVAIGLSRLGTPCTWIGRVGADGIGERITRELRAEGVAVVAIIDPEASTGLMVKEQRTPAATRVVYSRSASAGSALTESDVPSGLIESARLLHVTGITAALSKSALGALLAAMDRAERAGVPVSFDVNHRSALWRGRDAAGVYRALAERATIVFAGIDEARLLVPDAVGANEAAAGLATLGPSQVVIKLGDRGCVALVDGRLYHKEAIPIAPIDTVGAGDAFVAGYLAELLAGHPVSVRLQTAVRTGAFACLGPGDWESYASRADLAMFDAADPVQR